MLASIFNSLQRLSWSLSGGGEKPELVGPTWLTEASKRKLDMNVMSTDELDRKLREMKEKFRGLNG